MNNVVCEALQVLRESAQVSGVTIEFDPIEGTVTVTSDLYLNSDLRTKSIVAIGDGSTGTDGELARALLDLLN